MAEKTEDASNPARGVVPTVFIHGIKGSFLRHQDTQRLTYLKPCQALSVCGRLCMCPAAENTIGLPLKWNNVEGNLVQQSDNIEAWKPIDKLTILSFTAAKIYEPFLKFGEQMLERPFYPFAYDWRRSNTESMHKFEAFVEKIAEKHDGSKVQIVAHSMGGLITMGLLRRIPQHIHSVLFAGVPFGAGITFLEDLTHGSKLGLNSSLLSSEVMFSFPSSFTFFPNNEEQAVATEAFFMDHKSERVTLDIWDHEEWKRHGLSVLARDQSEEIIEHLKACLSTAQDYREKYLRYHNDIEYPKVAVLASDASPAKTHVRIIPSEKKDDITKFNFKEKALATKPGDGRVSFQNAKPYDGIKYKVFKATNNTEHSELLNDTVMVKEILDYLMQED